MVDQATASVSMIPPSSREGGAGAGPDDAVSPSHSLLFTQNRARQYAPVPVILGQHRVIPPLAADTITEVDGNDGQIYQRILVLWGYGPLRISDILIANSPVAEYEDIQIETREGRAGDAAFTLYPGDPIDMPVPMAASAIRVRITDQLPRSITAISAIVESQCLDWNGNAWAAAYTSNPASLLRYLLQHPSRRRPAADTDLDLDAFQDFHGFCETNGYEFNFIHDTRRSIWDMATDICAVARAAPTLTSGVWSVVVDDGAQSIADHFTEVNVGSFRIDKSFKPAPQGMRVRFPNRNKGWRRDERIVYRDGFDDSNALDVPTVSPAGITDPVHVWKFARYHLERQAATERWQADVSLENLLVSRGNRVTCQHDRLGVGIASGFVRAVNRDARNRVTSVDIDAPIQFRKANVAFQAKFRTVADADIVVGLNLAGAPGSDPVSRLVFAVPTAAAIAVGDLFSVGEEDNLQADALITRLERTGDLEATVSMTPYRAGLYTAESGAVPAFVSVLSDLDEPLPPLVVESIVSGRDVFQQLGVVLQPRMVVTVNAIPVAGATIQAQIRDDANNPWAAAEVISRSHTGLVLAGVQQDVTYFLRFRWVLPEEDRVGPWTAESHRVDPVAPDAPTGFGVTVHEDGTRVYRFTPPDIPDLAGLKIRYHATEGQDWDDMDDLHAGLLTASPLESLGPEAGEYDFVARAVTTDGIESADRRIRRTLRGQRRFVPRVVWASNAPGDGQDGDIWVEEGTGLIYERNADGSYTQIADLSGADGSTWHTGSSTPGADLGQDGDWYFRTSDATVWQKQNGAWNELFSIAGEDGATWHAGDGAPGPAFGVQGDWYFQTSNGFVFLKVGPMAWDFQYDLTGPQGEDGLSITGTARSGDTVTITYSDGTSDSFTLRDGADGTDIGIQSIATQDDGDIRVTFSDGSFFDIPEGEAGRGINSITRNSATNTVTVTFDDGSDPQTFTLHDGEDGEDGVSITGVSRAVISGVVTVTYSDGSRDTFTVLDGQDGGDGTSVTVSSVTTLSNGNIRVRFSDGTFADIPEGDAGRGISTITRNAATDTVRVTFDDGSAAQTFTLHDGADGDDGVSISSISRSVITGVVTVRYSNGTTDTFTVLDGRDGAAGGEGEDGEDGTSVTVSSVTTLSNGNIRVRFSDNTFADIPKGAAGRGINTITRSALLSRVTVTFDDGSAAQRFTLHDGEDGDDGADGADGEDGEDGEKGDKGDPGDPVSRAGLFDQLSVNQTTTGVGTTALVQDVSATALANGPNGERRVRLNISRRRITIPGQPP